MHFFIFRFQAFYHSFLSLFFESKYAKAPIPTTVAALTSLSLFFLFKYTTTFPMASSGVASYFICPKFLFPAARRKS